MKRTNISLTDEQYEWLRQRALDKYTSMSQLMRDYVDDRMIIKDTPEKKPQEIKSKITIKEVGDTIKDAVTQSIYPQPKKGKKK